MNNLKMVSLLSVENRDKLQNLQFNTARLKNNFVVSDFAVKTELDFVYSITDEGVCLLLNSNIFGEIPQDEVMKLCENSKVAIISNTFMEMMVFNVDEMDIINALM